MKMVGRKEGRIYHLKKNNKEEEEDKTSSRSKYKKRFKSACGNIKNCVQQVKLISITHIMTHLTNIRIKV